MIIEFDDFLPQESIHMIFYLKKVVPLECQKNYSYEN